MLHKARIIKIRVNVHYHKPHVTLNAIKTLVVLNVWRSWDQS